MKKLILFLLVIATALSAAGCERPSVQEEEMSEPVRGRSVINLQMREADTLDPIITTRQSVRDGLMIIYEPLFNVNETFTLENVLAEGYAFNENATVMTLKIKSGVLWHDGSYLTAEDVAYTVNKIKQSPSSSYYLNLESVERVEKINDYEVVFYLNKPNALLVYSLYFPIVKTNSDPSIPIGTGPFMYKESDGKSLTLTKNSAWHMGEVMSDGVKFLYMRTSAMAQEAFASGKIHAVTKDMLDTENFAIKENNTKHMCPDGMFEFIGFNADKGIFADPLLRIAASNAVNRSKIGEIFGSGIASGFPIMTGSGAFSPSYDTAEYNLDYAKEVIFSAGWTDADYDGLPEKAIDNILCDMEFTLLTAKGDNQRLLAAEEIKTELLEAGFTVKIQTVDSETYHERIAEGEYDAFLGAFYYSAPYNVTELLASYGSVNFSGYSSGEIDAALGQLASATDAQKASVAFSSLQALYIASQPIAGLVFRTTYVVTSPYIEGEIKPYPYSPYANIANWVVK